MCVSVSERDFYFVFVFQEMIGFERERDVMNPNVELNRRRRFKGTLSLTEVLGTHALVTCHCSSLGVVVSL